MRALRPGLQNFVKKGQGHGGGRKPQINRDDQPIELSRVNPAQEARNKNVLSQLDQISRQNMHARLSKSPTAASKSRSPQRPAANVKAAKTIVEKQKPKFAQEEVGIAPTDPAEFQFDDQLEQPTQALNARDLYSLGGVQQEQTNA